jgi:hypothetical protein
MTLLNLRSLVAKPAITSLVLTGFLAMAGSGHAPAASFAAGNLVVAVAQGTGNNTTVNMQEFTPTGSISGLNNIAISGSGTNAFRISGSAGTSGYLSLSADRTLMTMPGGNNTNTSSNENTLNPRDVLTLNSATTTNFTATYTASVTGNQERSATTIDNSNYYIIDQGGLYTNGGTTPSTSTNYLSTRFFGGQVYVLSAKTTNSSMFTIPSLTASSFNTLPGNVAADVDASDFYLISSGNNGTAYDILYVLSGAPSSAGNGLTKYSLVNGTWVSNGTDTNSSVKSGFAMAAASNGSGGVVFYMVINAGVAGNTIIKFTDAAGYNTSINDSTPTTILTASSSNIYKGISFAPLPVTISTTGALTALSTTQGTASASTSFTISAISLTNNITLTAPTGFEISTSSGSGYASSLALTETGGSVPATTIFVRLAASTATGTYSGPVTAVSSGVPTIYVPTASSTVSPAVSTPIIATTGTLSAMSTTVGTASSPSSFSASGSNLTGNITVTAPADFEISTSSGSGYTGALTLTPSSGTVAATTIYVRLAASDSVGTYSGNVSLASSGATTVNEAIPSSSVSSSAALTGLTSNAGGFSQQFSSTTLNYTEYVAASVTSVTLTPTAASGATVTVNAQSPSTAFSMSTGTNTLVVVVTNGGQNTTYTVNIIRAGAFTPGDLVVTTYGNLQVAQFHPDGLTTKITLSEFSPTIAPNSVPVMAYTIPSAASGNNVGMVGEYGSSSEGAIQQTPDGLYLTIGGYSAAPSFAYTGTGTVVQNTALAQSPCASVPRVGALIDVNTNANTSSVFNDIYNTNNTRCIFSPDDINMYLSGQGAGTGDEGGLYYAPIGDNTTAGGAAPTGIYNVVSTRNLFTFGGNLYYSCDQNSSKGIQTGIFEYTGFPTTNVQGIGTRLTPASAGGVNYSPEGVWFANATTMYVADTGDPKASGGTSDGGIQKWVNNGSGWTLAYTLVSPNFTSGGETGLEAITGTLTNGVASLYACSYTANDAAPNGLYGVTDTLTATSSTATLTELAAAPGQQTGGTNPDYNFKGVSFAPTGSPVNAQVASNVTSSGATLNASVDPQGTDTIAYFQYGTSPTSLGSTTTQQDLGSGTSAVPVAVGLTGLQPGTTYYYELVTVSNGLTSTYAVQSFTTTGTAPVNVTDTPTMPPAGLVILAMALMGFAWQSTRKRAEA